MLHNMIERAYLAAFNRTLMQTALYISGGNTRATGMLVQYKTLGSQEPKQLKLSVSDDFNSNKKMSVGWLAAMHKVKSNNVFHFLYYYLKESLQFEANYLFC